jgi:hypothetical protein
MLFTRAPYEELGPGNLFPIAVDLLILGGLFGAWFYERRKEQQHHARPRAAPEAK